jgi:hypothetical protein
VNMDANFQHRHHKHVGADPPLLQGSDQFGWLSDSEVEDTRLEVEAAKSASTPSSRPRLSSTIPVKVLDDCEGSYKAAQEKMVELDASAYDSKGIMALTCPHDVPIFVVDVKTKGEPRYLAVALLKNLAAMLPGNATIGVMYDIGDQLERTIEKVMGCNFSAQRLIFWRQYNIIPDISQRCSFAVSLFHAFGHRIQCQVVYNPRYRTGFGLANGEGNERIWSLCRDLIGPERVMGVSRRLRIIYRF